MSKNFEKDLEDLQTIVNKMENNLSLDEAIKNFKNGISIVQKCQKTINEAEQTILELTKDNQLRNINDTAEK